MSLLRNETVIIHSSGKVIKFDRKEKTVSIYLDQASWENNEDPLFVFDNELFDDIKDLGKIK